MRQIPYDALEKKTINLGDIPKTLSFIFKKDNKIFLACNCLTQISKLNNNKNCQCYSALKHSLQLDQKIKNNL